MTWNTHPGRHKTPKSRLPGIRIQADTELPDPNITWNTHPGRHSTPTTDARDPELPRPDTSKIGRDYTADVRDSELLVRDTLKIGRDP